MDAQQRSLRASKSTFAYKINRQRKEGVKGCARGSCEVIIKFTKGAKSRAGIREAIKYISREYKLELVDSDGITFKSKEDIDDIIHLIQMSADLPIELTKSLMLCPPRIAGISREDALESVRKTLTSMYPNNIFVMAYHKDTDNDHVHVVMNMDSNEGKRLKIKGKDYKEMRSKFAEHLIEYG